jgi:hypothetical protein
MERFVEVYEYWEKERDTVTTYVYKKLAWWKRLVNWVTRVEVFAKEIVILRTVPATLYKFHPEHRYFYKEKLSKLTTKGK